MKRTHQTLFSQKPNVSEEFALSESVVVYPGDCLALLKTVPDESLRLIVTSPPYNIGKEYEKRLHLDLYLLQQEQVIAECVRVVPARQYLLAGGKLRRPWSDHPAGHRPLSHLLRARAEDA